MIFIEEKKYKEIINLINLSKFSESLNLLKNLENLYSNDVNFNNLIGFVYQNLNDFNNANNYYRKSLELDNTNFDSNFNIGILNYKKKNFKEAEKIFHLMDYNIDFHFIDNNNDLYK